MLLTNKKTFTTSNSSEVVVDHKKSTCAFMEVKKTEKKKEQIESLNLL